MNDAEFITPVIGLLCIGPFLVVAGLMVLSSALKGHTRLGPGRPPDEMMSDTPACEFDRLGTQTVYSRQSIIRENIHAAVSKYDSYGKAISIGGETQEMVAHRIESMMGELYELDEKYGDCTPHDYSWSN